MKTPSAMIKRKGKRAAGLFGGPLPPKRPKFTYDRTFQRRLLRLLWQDHKLAAAVSHYLSPKHFTTTAYVYLAEQVLAYAGNNNHAIPLDALKVRAQHALRAGRLRDEIYKNVVLLSKTLKQAVPDKTFLKEEISHFVKHQTIREMILGSLEHLQKNDFKKIDKLLNKVLTVDQTVVMGGAGMNYTASLEARIERRDKFVKNGIPSGLRSDDHMVTGGPAPGTLNCIMAAPNAGKSQALVNTAICAITESERKERVLYFSITDLSEDYIGDRFDSRVSGVPINALKEEKKKVRRRVNAFKDQYGDCLRVKEYLNEPVSVTTLEAYVRHLERHGWYPTMIVVDYADELVDDSRRADATDESTLYVSQGNVFRQLRRMANRLGVAVWTATQTTRAALNKEVVDIHHLGESYTKAKICDLILAFCQTLEEEKRQEARFIIVKNRSGPKHIEFRVRVDWSRSRIRNL